MNNKKTNWGDILKSWVAVFTLIGFITTALIFLKGEIDTSLKEIINQHDHGYTDAKIGPSHADLRDIITNLEKKVSNTVLQQEADYADLVMAYNLVIGYAIVDTEPYKQLRAASAAYYRSRFLADCQKTCKDLELKRCKPNGKPYVHDVFIKVMRYNWPERSALVKSMRLH